jgi:hypothetical protein
MHHGARLGMRQRAHGVYFSNSGRRDVPWAALFSQWRSYHVGAALPRAAKLPEVSLSALLSVRRAFSVGLRYQVAWTGDANHLQPPAASCGSIARRMVRRCATWSYLSALPEMEAMLPGTEACARYDLAPEMEGDITVIARLGGPRRRTITFQALPVSGSVPMAALSDSVFRSWSRNRWLRGGAARMCRSGITPSSTQY